MLHPVGAFFFESKNACRSSNDRVRLMEENEGLTLRGFEVSDGIGSSVRIFNNNWHLHHNTSLGACDVHPDVWGYYEEALQVRLT